MFGILKSKSNVEYSTSYETIEAYTSEIKKIKIENQPFRLSGMLHILTNKVSDLLKKNRHRIYYDVKSEIGRYIVGDNDYLEQVLEIVVRDLLSLNHDYKVVLKLSKYKDKYLVFDIINAKGVMPKELRRAYNESGRLLSTLSEGTNAFIKAKKIVERMKGNIEVNSHWGGTRYTVRIPYYEDKGSKSNQNALKSVLQGKRALFIGSDKYDTKQTQYVFKSYGIHTENMKLEAFEMQHPDLADYNMAIIRSADLTKEHVDFFNSIDQTIQNDFKMIIIHELFEDKEKIALSKNIADAELYNPSVTGDVEEILYQVFILKSKAVKGINNIEVFDPESFTIKGKPKSIDSKSDRYKGAHIAIVEDSKVDQRIIRNILKFEGVTLYCMYNGSEMLKLLEQQEEIDIIFSDINMPVMDGLMMTRHIRSKQQWRHIPIISISSMAFSHEVEEMKNAGMNAAITKPIQAIDTHMALEKYLVMTPEIRNREITLHQVKFLFDKDVIDIDLGLSEAESIEAYQKHLLETMEKLRGTPLMFIKMINVKDRDELEKFAKSTLALCEGIHAAEMVKMFNTLLFTVSQKGKVELTDYMQSYKKNWKRLEKEVDKYIHNAQD
jgi:CheY-like chemotaxis protein